MGALAAEPSRLAKMGRTLYLVLAKRRVEANLIGIRRMGRSRADLQLIASSTLDISWLVGAINCSQLPPLRSRRGRRPAHSRHHSRLLSL